MFGQGPSQGTPGQAPAWGAPQGQQTTQWSAPPQGQQPSPPSWGQAQPQPQQQPFQPQQPSWIQPKPVEPTLIMGGEDPMFAPDVAQNSFVAPPQPQPQYAPQPVPPTQHSQPQYAPQPSPQPQQAPPSTVLPVPPGLKTFTADLMGKVSPRQYHSVEARFGGSFELNSSEDPTVQVERARDYLRSLVADELTKISKLV